MNIGSWNPFERALIYLFEKGERTNPGSELVATSRVTNISFLAICDTNRQVTMELMKKLKVVTVITTKKIRWNVTC